jgi:hypothetical protein
VGNVTFLGCTVVSTIRGVIPLPHQSILVARNDDGRPINSGTYCSHSLTTGYGPVSPRAQQIQSVYYGRFFTGGSFRNVTTELQLVQNTMPRWEFLKIVWRFGASQ